MTKKKDYPYQGEVCSKCGVNVFKVRTQIIKEIIEMSFDDPTYGTVIKLNDIRKKLK
jgi:hypothetical protein